LEEKIKKSSSSLSGTGISMPKTKTDFSNQRTKRNFHSIQMLQNAIIMLFQENNGIATERRF
jgi:hypothetical protein